MPPNSGRTIAKVRRLKAVHTAHEARIARTALLIVPNTAVGASRRTFRRQPALAIDPHRRRWTRWVRHTHAVDPRGGRRAGGRRHRLTGRFARVFLVPGIAVATRIRAVHCAICRAVRRHGPRTVIAGCGVQRDLTRRGVGQRKNAVLARTLLNVESTLRKERLTISLVILASRQLGREIPVSARPLSTRQGSQRGTSARHPREQQTQRERKDYAVKMSHAAPKSATRSHSPIPAVVTLNLSK